MTDVEEGLVGEGLLMFGEQRLDAAKCLLGGQRGIEAVVIQGVFPERGKEGVEAVAGQFLIVCIAELGHARVG